MTGSEFSKRRRGSRIRVRSCTSSVTAEHSTTAPIGSPASTTRGCRFRDADRPKISRSGSLHRYRWYSRVILVRAYETATIYCQTVGIGTPIVQDRRLREVDLGVLAGKKRAFVQPFAAGDINFAPDGGESYRAASRRIASWLLDVAGVLRDERPDCEVAVFTHTGTMRIVHSFFNPVTSGRQVFSREFRNIETLSAEIGEFRVPALWMDASAETTRNGFHQQQPADCGRSPGYRF